MTAIKAEIKRILIFFPDFLVKVAGAFFFVRVTFIV